MESIFTRTNFQHVEVIGKLFLKLDKPIKNDPGVNFTTFLTEKATPDQYLTLTSESRVNFQPRSIFFVTVGHLFIDIKKNPTFTISHLITVEDKRSWLFEIRHIINITMRIFVQDYDDFFQILISLFSWWASVLVCGPRPMI